MTNVSGNNRHHGRSFEEVIYSLDRELEYLSKYVKECFDNLGLARDKDAKKGLGELGMAFETFAKSLRPLLSGSKFWVSETVTDRSGSRDLKLYKQDLKSLKRDIARVMESQDQTGSSTYDGLKEITAEVDRMAQSFEKLREDMVKRILEHAKTSHPNDKNSDIDLVAHPAQPPVEGNELAVIESDPYTPQKYFWLVFGGIIFQKALFTNILNIIGFTLFVHFVPAIQELQAIYLPHDTTAKKAFREKAANCPVISLFKKPPSKQTINKGRGRTPSISVHPPEGLTAEGKAAASRTEAHVMDKDGPFVMTGTIETAVDGTPTLPNAPIA